LKNIKGLLICILLFGLFNTLESCKQSKNKLNKANNIKVKPFDVKGLDTLKTQSGLQYMLVKKVPNGALPHVGNQVLVHYTGFFSNGKVFDSSVQRGEALSFTLGIGQVIKGWDEGIALLHVGEKARFIIPYALAYGVEGSGPIPPISDLIFDVELISVEK
jgi:FKBP-type peptidyl-prolyl cis-trans isomerase